MNTNPNQRLGFDRTQRLRGRAAFAAVYAARCRKTSGPLVFCAKSNDLEHTRLGLSVSRKVANAVRRNRIKRLLREAYRLQQYDLPLGYDVVVVVRPHEPASLGAYQQWLRAGFTQVHRLWVKRQKGIDKNHTPAAVQQDPSSPRPHG